MILGPKTPVAKAASSASNVSFQEILSYFANLEDSTVNNLIHVRFLARRLFDVLSPSERVAFAGQIALLRFQSNDNNIALVFRNPNYFVRSFFTLLFESYRFPIAKEKWGDFYKLVSKCPDKNDKEQAPEKKEKKERNSTTRQNEALQMLTNYFIDVDPHIIMSLLPAFHAYVACNKGEKTFFINNLAFPFIESKTGPLVEKKEISEREGIDLGQKFRTLRQGADCGVMIGLFKSLEEANKTYQAKELAADTQATIRLFYEKFVSDKFHFPVIWQNIYLLKQYVDSFSSDKKDAPILSKGSLSKIQELWEQFYYQICTQLLSLDDIASFTHNVKRQIEATTGAPKKTTQDDFATTAPRRRGATDINPRTRMPVSPSMSDLTSPSSTSLAQLAASTTYITSPSISHAPTPCSSFSPSPVFPTGVSHQHPFDMSSENQAANFTPQFNHVRPSTPQRPSSVTVSLAAGRSSLRVPPISPPPLPDRPNSTSPLSVNSSSPSPQGSPAGVQKKLTPNDSPRPQEAAKEESNPLDTSFSKLQIHP